MLSARPDILNASAGALLGGGLTALQGLSTGCDRVDGSREDVVAVRIRGDRERGGEDETVQIRPDGKPAENADIIDPADG